MKRLRALIPLLLAGCTSSLTGSAQKGPMLLGSTITVAPIDAQAIPTGDVYGTETTDDLGTFALAVGYTGSVAITADGFYFDEVEGALSTAPVTLRAVAEIAGDGDQDIHVSPVTHLAAARARALMAGGALSTDAVDQAEAELQIALGIGPTGFDPGATGTDLDLLGGDTDGNAWLFAVSAVFLDAAWEQAGTDGPVDATLQELLNNFADDLEDDGTVDATRTAMLQSAQTRLCADALTANLQARLDELGSSAVVPDLDRVLDHDLDGIADADEVDPVPACWIEGTHAASEYADVVLAGATGEFGRRGGFVGDVDSDGAGDLALIDGAAAEGMGRIYVHAGAAGGPSTTASGTVTGVRSGGGLTAAVGVGDVDGDGIGDLLVGDVTAEGAEGTSGGAYLLAGPIAGDLTLDAAYASFLGTSDGDSTGDRVTALGDIDGDGWPDIAVSAPGAEVLLTWDGAVYVLTGQPTGTLTPADATATIRGEAAWDQLGSGLAGVGDMSGDGVPDLAVGALKNDAGGDEAGAAYVFTSALAGVVSAADADLRVIGSQDWSSVGTFLEPAGDVDGDGLDDLLVYANLGSDAEGAAVNLFLGGRTGELTLTEADAMFVNDTPSDQAGASLAAGDLDGDAAIDLAIGAQDWGGGQGRVYLFLAAGLGTFDMEDADGILEGDAAPSARLGALTRIGDADADGGDDLLLSNAGEALLYFGAGP